MAKLTCKGCKKRIHDVSTVFHGDSIEIRYTCTRCWFRGYAFARLDSDRFASTADFELFRKANLARQKERP